MRALLLAIALALAPAGVAQAKIVPQHGIAGADLGMTQSQVRHVLGKPDQITHLHNDFSGTTDLIYGYGPTNVTFSGTGLPVTMVRTTSRGQRTARGVGVGSSRTSVRSRVPGARCRTDAGRPHCYVGSFTPGRTVTDFILSGKGRVEAVTVGIVMD
jgi:hypothetical protein